jgi:hypothetical protein
MSILFELEKLLVEHFEGFISLPREGDKLQIFFGIRNKKFQLKNSKNSLIGSAKGSASMVGEMFAIVTMIC